MGEIETVKGPEPECPTCKNDTHVMCEECGNHWKLCFCVDSLMGCETCGTFFAWTPDADGERQQVQLDKMLDDLREELDEENDKIIDTLKLGNTRSHQPPHEPSAKERAKKNKKKGKATYDSGRTWGESWGTGSHVSKSCKHVMSPVTFTQLGESVTVYATAGRDRGRRAGDQQPDFGLYLDSIWAKPPSRNEFINWPDFKTPAIPVVAVRQIVDAYIRACQGEKVEIGCIGAHGRTGTVLACMAALAGYTPSDAIKHVRDTYCDHAVETKGQAEWVQWFHDYLFKGGN